MQSILANPVPAAMLLGVVLSFYRWCTAPTDEDRHAAEWMLVTWLMIIPLMLVAHLVLLFATKARVLRLDQYGLYVDGLLGFQPAISVARFAKSHAAISLLVRGSYNALPIPMAGAIMTYLWLRPAESLRITALIFATLVGAAPFYFLVPMCGPLYAFDGFPFHVPSIVHPAGMVIQSPPNCMPSVHFGMALMIAWLLWRWKSGRVCGIVFAILTAFATLGSGEHYFIDLVASVPYVWAVHRVVAPRVRLVSFAKPESKVLVAAA